MEIVEEMSVPRQGVGVGVIDSVLYAVGGHSGFKYLKSVEVYNPTVGVWSLIPEMNLCRYSPGDY